MVATCIQKIMQNMICVTGVYTREMINIFCESLSDLVKNCNIGIYSDTMQDDTSHWAWPVHTTFSDLGLISRSQQHQKVLTEHFVLLSSWNFVG